MSLVFRMMIFCIRIYSLKLKKRNQEMIAFFQYF